MSNNMDESTWESYNEFYNELKTDKNSMDIFEDGLKCFSSYLCHACWDYAYNATYLPGFIEEFRIFIKAFSIKYEIAKALFEAAESYHNLTLKIDRYWLFETDENGKVKKSILGGPDFVSEKTLTIEGSILCDMQRYIYHEQYEMDKVELNKEKSSKVLSDKVVSDFKDFLDKHIPNNTKERGK